MSSRYLWRLLTRRRGTSPAGVSLACGYGKRSVSTGTKPWTGMSAVTVHTVEGCSFTVPLGNGPGDEAIRQMLHLVNSFTAPGSSGGATAARGVSGQPPECAD